VNVPPVPRDASGGTAGDRPAASVPARRQRRFFVRLFVVVVDLLGVAVLFGLLAAAGWYLYKLQVRG
jgi:hypothetical protein